ncbi:MAG: glycosyltransferase family 61 protein [Aphanizomenon gracile PMC644.10]|nr:glycosyltransferase family 61 protein [Aphanizomenon gracile PMC644.10]
MKNLTALKSSLRRFKSIFRPKIPAICEDLMVWASSRKWPIIKLHDAFTLKLDIPANASEHETLYRRFLANHDLGFSAQFLVGLPHATILSSKGVVVLEQGAYLAQGNWRVMNVLSHPDVYSHHKRKQKYLAGDWYSIHSYWSHSYHHWFWDDLPRLLTAIPHLPPDTQFLVGEPFSEFQRESLQALGIAANRIKVQPSDINFKIERLWFATPLGDSEFAATAPDVAQQLQAIFNPTPHPSPYRKIYISRSLARYRRIVNESELIPILEDFGFEIFHTEKLSFASQVKLFSEAKVILSSHGAGLTNMLFSSSSALILELFEPTAARPHYWMMAHALGHNYDCLVGERVEKNNQTVYDPDFTICPEKFLNFLKNHLK